MPQSSTRPRPPTVVLGSASPRRSSLLRSLGIDFDIHVAQVDEASHDGVIAIAQAKFDHLAGRVADAVLITADTLVELDGDRLAKPADRADARAMLERMSGRTLTVETAVVIGRPGTEPAASLAVTEVRLRALCSEEVDAYLASGAADDKAGALELQGRAAAFIEGVDGCWPNVAGLPLCVVAADPTLDCDAGLEGNLWTERCTIRCDR